MRPVQSSQAQFPPSDQRPAKRVAARLVSPVWRIDHRCLFSHLGSAVVGRTIYSSVLSNTSASYCREDPCPNGLCYYEALKITVSTAGNYTIRSNSSMDTYGYIYNNTFDTSYPSRNMLQFNDEDADAQQFLLSMWLQTMITYIVVATTYGASVTGSFSIIVQGPAVVSLSLTNATGQ